jgi:hypothetical protein
MGDGSIACLGIHIQTFFQGGFELQRVALLPLEARSQISAQDFWGFKGLALFTVALA